jgi:hypothetical protein
MSHSLLAHHSDRFVTIDRIIERGTSQYFPKVVATVALESLQQQKGSP